MTLTPGEMLFYGGIIGAAVVVLISIIVIVILTLGWKRMNKKQTERYGRSSNVDI